MLEHQKEFREILAPRTIREGDEAFHSVEELEYVAAQPECLNIALTGNYGSGKSSVIHTFLSRIGEKKKVLNVSLSTFMQGDDGEHDNEVESKLFQHILYTSDAKNTPQTGFRRILHLSNTDAWYIVGQIALFLLSFIIVFEPVLLRIPAFYVLYHKCLPENYDYPAMVVGCQYNSHDACGRSLSVPKYIAKKIHRDELHTAVVSSLRSVKPGEKIPGHYVDSHTQRVRFLGTCAEDDAASQVLRGLGVANGFKLNNLGFTKAIRPRTGSKKSYCATCKQVFG